MPAIALALKPSKISSSCGICSNRRISRDMRVRIFYVGRHKTTLHQPETKMAKLYISYKSQDADLARQLAAELENLGHTAVYDAVALEPGQNWRTVLLRALVESDAVVVLITPQALSSPFVMGEIGATRALQHVYGRTLLLPVLVGEVDLPSVVSDLFTIRLKPEPQGIREAASELARAFSEHQSRARRGFPKIFISHRHSDVAVVQELVNVLE